MDREMKLVEDMLAQTGHRCNVRVVDSISQGYAKIHSENASRVKDRNALASQLAILEECPVIITRVLRRKGSLLQAAKLLLLSRLIHKTLSQRPDAPPLVDHLKDRLSSLRVKLLRAIDKRFANPEQSVTRLVDDMCAYALAMSSTPSDVMQHFLNVRMRAIQWHLAQDSNTQTHVLKAMRLLLSTLQNSQLLFPKRLSEALLRLKDLPLVKQADVQSVTELRLDIHMRWLTDELRNYTPWPRHDELQKSEADRLIRGWAKSAQKAFVTGLAASLEEICNFDKILEIRQHLFEAWPWTDRRLPGLHSADVVDELREAFNERMAAIVQMQVKELNNVCKMIRGLLRNPGSVSLEEPLWSSSLTDMEVGVGGQYFKNAILSSYNGIQISTSPILVYFDEWISSINQIQADLKKMRDAHWEDDLGVEEEDNEIDSRQTLLSKDDPRILGDCLSKALQNQAKSLSDDFRALLNEVLSETESTNNNGTLGAVTLLRILREIFRRASVQDKILAEVTIPLISTDLITPLHERLSRDMCTKVRGLLSKSLVRLENSPVLAGKALWEGKPPLPIQPSAMVFRLLKEVTGCMADLGADLWSEAAVRAVKNVLSAAIAEELKRTVLNLSTEPKSQVANGDTSRVDGQHDSSSAEGGGNDSKVVEQADGKELRRDKLTQLAMDLTYLNTALSTRSRANLALQELIELVMGRIQLADAEKARVKKSATECWKRTYLLFALLVPEP
ncbi:hypothetical protein, variant 1 [Verruconis gallopava]|nr:hypothetical protein, variant 1 [Verruconis gallopava]KIV99094.1 hypothetical protein, variant 1 [Verruconis gallopava]